MIIVLNNNSENLLSLITILLRHFGQIMILFLEYFSCNDINLKNLEKISRNELSRLLLQHGQLILKIFL